MGTRLIPNENETGYRTMAAMSMAAFCLWLCAASILVTVVRGIAVRSSPGADCLHVNTTTHRLVDNYGRERYFHGVNVVMKRPPWLPRMDKFDPHSSFVEKDMQVLSDLGLNGIRLGMMWPGAEPERGKYNETYFSASKILVNSASKYGIYTLLDMHQDVLSPKFCGEGVPDWAVDTGNAPGFPYPIDSPYKIDPETGYPTSEDCAKHAWSLGYPTEATCAAFQNIYNNTNGLLDSLAAFWGKVAQEFLYSPYILGYEIINEPWAGDLYADLELAIPKVADRRNLAKVYEVVNTEIRKYDQCHNLFFESVTWDETTVGFEQVPGGLDYTNRSVLSWHFYIPPMITPLISFPERQKDVERLHCAGFLTEFGITSEDAVTVMDEADKYLQSWLGWEYKSYAGITGSGNSIWYDNGTMNLEIAALLSRTYAPSVAGVVQQMEYSHTTEHFTLVYYLTKMCTANTTEIYLNEALHYKNGYTVAIQPEGVAVWTSPRTNHIEVTHNAGLPERTAIQVTITPK